jgi:hypothetical protein
VQQARGKAQRGRGKPCRVGGVQVDECRTTSTKSASQLRRQKCSQSGCWLTIAQVDGRKTGAESLKQPAANRDLLTAARKVPDWYKYTRKQVSTSSSFGPASTFLGPFCLILDENLCTFTLLRIALEIGRSEACKLHASIASPAGHESFSRSSFRKSKRPNRPGNREIRATRRSKRDEKEHFLTKTCSPRS